MTALQRAWRRRLVLRRRGMHACPSVKTCGYYFRYDGHGKWTGPYGATHLTPRQMTRAQLLDSYPDCTAGLRRCDWRESATVWTRYTNRTVG